MPTLQALAGHHGQGQVRTGCPQGPPLHTGLGQDHAWPPSEGQASLQSLTH